MVMVGWLIRPGGQERDLGYEKQELGLSAGREQGKQWEWTKSPLDKAQTEEKPYHLGAGGEKHCGMRLTTGQKKVGHEN